MMRFGIRFQEIYTEKIINFELYPQIYLKINELDYPLKNQHFIIDYIQKNSIILMKKIVVRLLVCYSFVAYIGKISHFYSEQLFFTYFCDCLCVCFHLFGKFKSLKEPG